MGKPGEAVRVDDSPEGSDGDPDDCEADDEGGGDKEDDDEADGGEEGCGEEDRLCNDRFLEEDDFLDSRGIFLEVLLACPSLRLPERPTPSSAATLSDSGDDALLSSGYGGARSLWWWLWEALNAFAIKESPFPESRFEEIPVLCESFNFRREFALRNNERRFIPNLPLSILGDLASARLLHLDDSDDAFPERSLFLVSSTPWLEPRCCCVGVRLDQPRSCKTGD